MNTKFFAAGLITVAICRCADPAFGQLPSAPQTYSDFYRNDLSTFRRPPFDPRKFTYDRMFYHNPAVSPYTNLMRPTNRNINNYFEYVQPEEQRREASALQFEQMQRSRADTAIQGASAYQNHWYGGRQSLGLR